MLFRSPAPTASGDGVIREAEYDWGDLGQWDQELSKYISEVNGITHWSVDHRGIDASRPGRFVLPADLKPGVGRGARPQRWEPGACYTGRRRPLEHL